MKAKCVHQQIAGAPSDNGRLTVDTALTRIHVIGTNRPLNQSLVFLLETFKDVWCSWSNSGPSTSEMNSESVNTTIYLIDCLACNRRTINDRIRHYSEAIAKGTKLVLFNADADKTLSTFLDKGSIHGIFYHNESKTNFIKGIKTILKGDTWVTPNACAPPRKAATQKNNPTHEDGRGRLSKRELEILDCIAKGMTNSSIADQYQISLHTVKAHVYNIYRKINVFNRLQAKIWFDENRYNGKFEFYSGFLRR
ncbi:two component system transcriptional regulator, LuxR family [Desulfosarcina variabilis str. Montpellier]|uniref:helix-turn-helix transcriptional regulator n=1 Tax=Desulfosarcina variabilis TaxID=2300 RepID=UPI003AFAC320